MNTAEAPGNVDVEARWLTLRAKIEVHAPNLRKQGGLVLKKSGGRRYWYLRFLLPPDDSGHRRHACIYVCSEADLEMLTRTQRLLKYYRDQAKWTKDVYAYANFVASIKTLTLRQFRAIGRSR